VVIVALEAAVVVPAGVAAETRAVVVPAAGVATGKTTTVVSGWWLVVGMGACHSQPLTTGHFYSEPIRRR